MLLQSLFEGEDSVHAVLVQPNWLWPNHSRVWLTASTAAALELPPPARDVSYSDTFPANAIVTCRWRDLKRRIAGRPEVRIWTGPFAAGVWTASYFDLN